MQNSLGKKEIQLLSDSLKKGCGICEIVLKLKNLKVKTKERKQIELYLQWHIRILKFQFLILVKLLQ